MNNMKLEEHLLLIALILVVAGGVYALNYSILYRRDTNSSGVYHVTVDDTSYVSDICPYVNTKDKYVRMRLYGNKVEFPFTKSVTINMSVK